MSTEEMTGFFVFTFNLNVSESISGARHFFSLGSLHSCNHSSFENTASPRPLSYINPGVGKNAHGKGIPSGPSEGHVKGLHKNSDCRSLSSLTLKKEGSVSSLCFFPNGAVWPLFQVGELQS